MEKPKKKFSGTASASTLPYAIPQTKAVKKTFATPTTNKSQQKQQQQPLAVPIGKFELPETLTSVEEVLYFCFFQFSILIKPSFTDHIKTEHLEHTLNNSTDNKNILTFHLMCVSELMNEITRELKEKKSPVFDVREKDEFNWQEGKWFTKTPKNNETSKEKKDRLIRCFTLSKIKDNFGTKKFHDEKCSQFLKSAAFIAGNYNWGSLFWTFWHSLSFYVTTRRRRSLFLDMLVTVNHLIICGACYVNFYYYEFDKIVVPFLAQFRKDDDGDDEEWPKKNNKYEMLFLFYNFHNELTKNHIRRDSKPFEIEQFYERYHLRGEFEKERFVAMYKSIMEEKKQRN